MTQKEKLQKNIVVIKIALSGETLSIEKAKEFSGWGGIKAVLYDPYSDDEWENVSQADKGMRDSILELHEVLKANFSDRQYKDAISSIKNATLTSFFTPSVLVRTFYEVLSQYMVVDKFYDPSAGTGLFLLESAGIMSVGSAILYEKDLVTGMVLKAIMSNPAIKIPVDVHVKGFEESSDDENGKYNLITSNIPFNDIKIYDPKFTDKNICNRIHAYFFAKAIDKLSEGGVLAFLVSNAFLDSVTGKTARKYVFDRCDFVSLTVLPDNLMFESAGTMAPSHFIVVQKNSSKTCLSGEEEELIYSEFTETSKGKVAENAYIHANRMDITVGDSVVLGKNQYGKPAYETKWDNSIDGITIPFIEILERDFYMRFRKPEQKLVFGSMIPNPAFDKILEDNWNDLPDPPGGCWNPEAEDERQKELAEQQGDAYDELFSKATESAIESCGLSDIFKNREEWEMTEVEEQILEQKEFAQQYEEPQDQPTTGTEPNKFKWEGELPEYIPFKNGLIVEI